MTVCLCFSAGQRITTAICGTDIITSVCQSFNIMTLSTASHSTLMTLKHLSVLATTIRSKCGARDDDTDNWIQIIRHCWLWNTRLVVTVETVTVWQYFLHCWHLRLTMMVCLFATQNARVVLCLKLNNCSRTTGSDSWSLYSMSMFRHWCKL